MSSPKRREDPKVGSYVLHGWWDESVAFALLLQREWRSALLVLAIIAVGISLLEPVPHTTLRIAKGQPGSGLEVMALRYRDALARHGVKVELVGSDGAPDNLRLVSQGLADVGLAQSGLPPLPAVTYLGSVAYQPLWLFHTGKPGTDDLPAFLAGKRVSVGIPGSGSRLISDRLLQEYGETVRSRIDERVMNNPSTISAMRDGSLDATFLLATFDSRNTQALLSDPGFVIHDFALTEGISRRWGFSEPVVLPAGAVSVYPPRPAKDVRMVAVTMTLVVHQDLHPATQSLLLSISRTLAERSEDVFTRGHGFPAFVDRQLPRSPVATRYYERGAPLLSGRMPYWAVSLIDSLWVSVVALLAIAYPFMRFMPSQRKLAFDALVSRRYKRLRAIEDQLQGEPSRRTLMNQLNELDQLMQQTRDMWIPSGCSSHHGALLSALMQLEARLLERLAARPVYAD